MVGDDIGHLTLFHFKPVNSKGHSTFQWHICDGRPGLTCKPTRSVGGSCLQMSRRQALEASVRRTHPTLSGAVLLMRLALIGGAVDHRSRMCTLIGSRGCTMRPHSDG